MHAYAFAAYVFTFVLSFALLLRLELDASEVWRSLPTSAVITRLSAAMDGQPRHQHRPPSTASHRTFARRPPTPFEAHRALRQRRLKASSHIYIHENTFAPTILPSSSATDTHPTFHQQHLYKRSLRGSALSHQHGRPTQERRHRTIHGRPTQERRHRTINKILARGQRFSRNDEGTISADRTVGEFKGCQWQTSKGDS